MPATPEAGPEATGLRPTLGTKYRSTGGGLPGPPHLDSYEETFERAKQGSEGYPGNFR